MLLTPIKAGRLEIEKGDYHGDRGRISHSGLEVFRRSVPLYHGMYVTGKIPFPEPQDYFEIGSAFHVLLLEPEKFDDEVAVMPEKWDRRTKVGRESYEAFREENRGKAMIAPDDFILIQEMRDSCLLNKTARALIEADGKPEYGIQWNCKDSGIACKSRIDKLVTKWSRPVIVDLKTTADPIPSAWGKSVGNFGYHRQQAFYQDGADLALEAGCRFLFVAVGKKQPYECVVYELKPEAVALGRKQNREDLLELRDCVQYDSWPSRHAEEVVKLDLPKWAYYE